MASTLPKIKVESSCSVRVKAVYCKILGSRQKQLNDYLRSVVVQGRLDQMI